MATRKTHGRKEHAQLKLDLLIKIGTPPRDRIARIQLTPLSEPLGYIPISKPQLHGLNLSDMSADDHPTMKTLPVMLRGASKIGWYEVSGFFLMMSKSLFDVLLHVFV